MSKCLAFQQIAATPLATAAGIGLPLGTPSAYDPAHAYSVGNTALFASKDGISSAAANWYCIKAGTGKMGNSNYWLELDTSGIPVLADYAVLQAAVHGVRWTDDGSTPTSTLGFLLALAADGDPSNDLVYKRGPLRSITVIAAAGGSVLHVGFYMS